MSRDQSAIDAHFSSEAAEWTAIYARGDVRSLIHQQRLTMTLAAVDSLGLSGGAAALDVGCGAGILAVELAGRGFTVEAIDTVPAMLDATRDNARRAGVAGRVHVAQGDTHALVFTGGRFDLVTAIGVLPWAHDPGLAVGEIGRVLAPGAHAVLTADNALRLAYFVDPVRNPALAGVRRAVKGWAARRGLIRLRPHARQFSKEEVRRLIAAAGLETVEHRTFGFGVFTLLRVPFLPQRLAVWLHWALQRLADRRARVVRNVGAQHFVVVRRPASGP